MIKTICFVVTGNGTSFSLNIIIIQHITLTIQKSGGCYWPHLTTSKLFFFALVNASFKLQLPTAISPAHLHQLPLNATPKITRTLIGTSVPAFDFDSTVTSQIQQNAICPYPNSLHMVQYDA